MDERKELLQAIRRSRRKLNIAKLIDTCVFCLAYAGVAAIVLEAVSLWIPFYYVHLCVVIVIGIALIVGIIYAVIKRTSMREAAQQIDTFGLKERVQTAYEQMADESPLAGMQRHDAAEQLQKKLDADSDPAASFAKTSGSCFSFPCGGSGAGFCSVAGERTCKHQTCDPSGSEGEAERIIGACRCNREDGYK